MRRRLYCVLFRKAGYAHFIDCSLECISAVVLRDAVAPPLSIRRKLVVSIQQQILKFLIILPRPEVKVIASTVGTVFFVFRECSHLQDEWTNLPDQFWNRYALAKNRKDRQSQTTHDRMHRQD
jgi:hypothetical protein